MPDLAHTDTLGWIALAFLIVIALAWAPVIKLLVVDTWRLLHPSPPPADLDLDGLAAELARQSQERENEAWAEYLTELADRKARVERIRAYGREAA